MASLEERLEKLRKKRGAPIPQPRMAGVERPTGLQEFGAAAAEGATFGFLDEIADILSPGTGERVRRGMEEMSPALRLGGNVTGGILTGGPVGSAVAGTKTAAALPTFARYGLLGAGEGALAGAGFAMPGERLKGAGTGAAFGGALGMATPALTGAVAAPVRAAKRGAAKVFRRPAAKAKRKLGESLARDEISPARLKARLKMLGEKATVADAAGENVRGLAQATADIPGPGRNRARTILGARQRGAQGRVRQSLRRVLSGESYKQTQDDIIKARSAAAEPFYKQARAAGEVDNELIKEAMESRDVRRAISQAKARFPEYKDLPDNDMRLLDKAYKSIGGKAQAARRSGDKELARDLDQVRLMLRDGITEDVPVYGKALDTFSDASTLKDALEDGVRFIREDIEDLGGRLAGMSEGERDMFLIGVTKSLVNQIDNSQAPKTAINRVFGNPTMRDKLRLLMPDPKDFNAFRRAVVRETRFGETSKSVLGGSPTAGKQTRTQDVTGGDLQDSGIGVTG